jgi:hypothetical protein
MSDLLDWHTNPLPVDTPKGDLSFDQFMDIEDSEDRIDKKRRV